MTFTSMQYAVFLPVVFIIHYILPRKIRYIWLLCASYYFYMCWNAKYALLILTVTVTTYFGARIIQFLKDADENQRSKTIWLVAVIAFNLALLFYFKYTNFLIENINILLTGLGQNPLDLLEILLPVGISFFVFQTIGYVIDVYRDEISAEKNFFRYALFVSFFPQLVAGPIERSKNLLKQLAVPAELDGENIRTGLLYILFGVWQKVLVADNAAVIVNRVYGDYLNYIGIQIFLATALFALEIYCDFGGYSNIAIGTARLFGVRLMRNFDSPYLAVSVSDFWRRWHISLTSWFRDYLYIPLGGNRKGRIRKYINTLLVFLASGIWHGAGWTFLFWGMLSGFYMVAEDILGKHKAIGDGVIVKWIRRLITFLLICFSWLFFRAETFSSAIEMIIHALRHSGIIGLRPSSIIMLFSGYQKMLVTVVAIVTLLSAGLIRERNKGVDRIFFKLPECIRWMVYIFLVYMVIVYGAYGEGYEQTQFIYFQF